MYASTGLVSQDSGLWHHMQLRGQPFRKIVVRMPGPSCRLKRWISKTTAVGFSVADTVKNLLLHIFFQVYKACGETADPYYQITV